MADGDGRERTAAGENNLIPPRLCWVEVIQVNHGEMVHAGTAEREVRERQRVVHVIVQRLRAPVQAERDLVPLVGHVRHIVRATHLFKESHAEVAIHQEERGDFAGQRARADHEIAARIVRGTAAHIKRDLTRRDVGQRVRHSVEMTVLAADQREAVVAASGRAVRHRPRLQPDCHRPLDD